jgi:hypothetical protein
MYSLCIQLRAEYMYNTLYQNLTPLYSLSRDYLGIWGEPCAALYYLCKKEIN